MAIKRDKVEKIIKKFLKKHKKLFMTCISMGIFFVSTGFTFTSGYPELQPLLDLIQLFINLVRFASASIGGIIATIAGWNIMTNTNGQGMKIAKNTFGQALSGLVVVFFGATFVDFMINKLAPILLG